MKQSNVIFDAINHTYTTPEGVILSGITGMIGRQLFPNKYSAVPESVLQKKAERGLLIHEDCRNIDEWGSFPQTHEGSLYRELQLKEGFVPAENEYIVSDNKHFATAVDIVDTEFNLYDIKTTSVLDHDYLSWQLSINAYLFEVQNGFPAGKLYAIWLRDTAKLIPITPKPREEVIKLLECEINGEQYTQNLPEDVNDMLQKLSDLEFSIMEIEQTAKSYEEKAKQLREGLKAEMEKSGVKKWETDNIVVTYVNATERKGIDTTKLKEEQPSIYEQYSKVTNVNSTIKIKLK